MTFLLAFGGAGNAHFTKDDSGFLVVLVVLLCGLSALNKSTRKEKE
jgi:hypothetical protein